MLQIVILFLVFMKATSDTLPTTLSMPYVPGSGALFSWSYTQTGEAFTTIVWKYDAPSTTPITLIILNAGDAIDLPTFTQPAYASRLTISTTINAAIELSSITQDEIDGSFTVDVTLATTGLLSGSAVKDTAYVFNPQLYKDDVTININGASYKDGDTLDKSTITTEITATAMVPGVVMPNIIIAASTALKNECPSKLSCPLTITQNDLKGITEIKATLTFGSEGDIIITVTTDDDTTTTNTPTTTPTDMPSGTTITEADTTITEADTTITEADTTITNSVNDVENTTDPTVSELAIWIIILIVLACVALVIIIIVIIVCCVRKKDKKDGNGASHVAHTKTTTYGQPGVQGNQGNMYNSNSDGVARAHNPGYGNHDNNHYHDYTPKNYFDHVQSSYVNPKPSVIDVKNPKPSVIDVNNHKPSMINVQNPKPSVIDVQNPNKNTNGFTNAAYEPAADY